MACGTRRSNDSVKLVWIVAGCDSAGPHHSHSHCRSSTAHGSLERGHGSINLLVIDSGDQLTTAAANAVLNVLIFAFAQPARAWTLQSVEATAEELQFELALEFPRFLQRLRTGHLL